MVCLKLLFMFLLTYCDCANILYIIPFSSKSHYIMLKPLGVELARRGHNVTVITTYMEDNPPSNYHELLVEYKQIWNPKGTSRPNVFKMIDLPHVQFHDMILWRGGSALTEWHISSPEVQKMLASDYKFDLVINEQFYQDAFNIFAHKYGAPLVLVSTFGNCMRHNLVTRNPMQMSTVMSEFIVIRDPRSFWGRLYNLYFTVYEYIYWRFWYLEKHEEFVRKNVNNLPQPVPSLYEMQMKTALYLSNGHFSYDTPTAYQPNIVEVAGIHIEDRNMTLPKDLQKILDDSKHGVVYVNFGSNVRSSELPDEKKNALLKVFRRLKYTVLWKWEDDQLENKPDNLVVRKWLPQMDILAHPNVKVFVAHGGLIGLQEAIYYGVPIIGVPIYADQYNNMLQAQEVGYGRILEYHDLNEESLKNVLDDILENDTYRIKAKEISKRFKDRPLSPMDTAIYWIEYVIRYKGAEFIRNPGLKLNWFAYNMLDVYSFVLLIILVLCYIVIYITKILLQFLKSNININMTKKKLQ